MSEAQMFKQMEMGKLLAEDVLPKVAKQYSKVARENGALEAASKKVNSEYNRFLNALTELKLQLFQGGFGQGMVSVFKTLTNMMSSTSMLQIGAVFGGMLAGVADAVYGLTLPFRMLIDLFNALFGQEGAKWLGYSLAIAFVTTKIFALTKAMMGLLAVSRAMAMTPIGLAITGAGLLTAVGAAYAYDGMANNMSQKYSNQMASQQVNVKVEPNERGFTKLIKTEVEQSNQSWSRAMAEAGNA